jgi:hypothetical protein
MARGGTQRDFAQLFVRREAFFLLPLKSARVSKKSFRQWGGLAPVAVGITRLTWQLERGGLPRYPVPAQRSKGRRRGVKSDLVKVSFFTIVSPPLRDKEGEGASVV